MVTGAVRARPVDRSISVDAMVEVVTTDCSEQNQRDVAKYRCEPSASTGIPVPLPMSNAVLSAALASRLAGLAAAVGTLPVLYRRNIPGCRCDSLRGVADGAMRFLAGSAE
jgi:hypothetical protein